MQSEPRRNPRSKQKSHPTTTARALARDLTATARDMREALALFAGLVDDLEAQGRCFGRRGAP